MRLDVDESPHDFGGGEWWYYTGRVTDEDGRGYGIEAVIFHVPRLPFLLFVLLENFQLTLLVIAALIVVAGYIRWRLRREKAMQSLGE